MLFSQFKTDTDFVLLPVRLVNVNDLDRAKIRLEFYNKGERECTFNITDKEILTDDENLILIPIIRRNIDYLRIICITKGYEFSDEYTDKELTEVVENGKKTGKLEEVVFTFPDKKINSKPQSSSNPKKPSSKNQGNKSNNDETILDFDCGDHKTYIDKNDLEHHFCHKLQLEDSIDLLKKQLDNQIKTNNLVTKSYINNFHRMIEQDISKRSISVCLDSPRKNYIYGRLDVTHLQGIDFDSSIMDFQMEIKDLHTGFNVKNLDTDKNFAQTNYINNKLIEFKFNLQEMNNPHNHKYLAIFNCDIGKNDDFRQVAEFSFDLEHIQTCPID